MTRRGLLLFASMCVIWGIPYLFIRIAVLEISPFVLVCLRCLLAAAILLPIAVAGRRLTGLRGHWAALLAFAAIEIALPWLLLATAEQRLSSSLTGLLISAVPLVATVLAVAGGTRDSAKPVALAGLLVGIVGVGLVVGFNLRGGAVFAIVEVFGVAVCYAVGPAILARYLSQVPALAVNSISLALCGLAYLPAAALGWPHALPDLRVLAAIAILAVVCTALAFQLFTSLIAEIGPVRATVITYLNPAVAAVAGVAFLGETLTPAMIAGFALILVGSVLATRRPRVVEPAPA